MPLITRVWKLRRNEVLQLCVRTATAICFSGLTVLSLSAAEDGKITIVAFGDSTTAPRGELKIYADLLQQQLPGRGMPVRVINSGIGGNHTNLASARFKRDVLSHQPDIVIIQFGINDAAIDVWTNPPSTTCRVPLKEYESRLREFIRELASRNIKIVLMTPNPLRWTPELRERYGKAPYRPNDEGGFNVILSKYAERVRQISITENVPLIDVYRLFEEYGQADGQSVSELLLDGMHPNEPGHRLIADSLMSLLLESHPQSSQQRRTPRSRCGSRPQVSDSVRQAPSSESTVAIMGHERFKKPKSETQIRNKSEIP